MTGDLATLLVFFGEGLGLEVSTLEDVPVEVEVAAWVVIDQFIKLQWFRFLLFIRCLV
jgi:hypothetical protein